MGYENGLIGPPEDWQQAPPPIVGGEEAGQWDPGTIDKWRKNIAAGIKAARAAFNQYKPIKWQSESGMAAVTQTQKTVAVPVEITAKPRGSWLNRKYGNIQPGDVVFEVARGTASSVPNSYVYWQNAGVSGWVRTGELKNIAAEPVSYDFDYGQGGSTPYSAAEPVSYDFDYGQAGSTPYSAAQPAKKLPVLPLAAIGYFLLNR